MGRYDWEEKQRKRNAISKRPMRFNRSAALALVAIGLAGTTVIGVSSSEPATYAKPNAEAHNELLNSSLSKPLGNSTSDISVPAAVDPAQVPVQNEMVAPTQKSQSQTQQFDHCGSIRITCVVDGDTIWLEGVKIRIADIDTPEVSKPSCASEKALGDRATNRLIALLNEGPFELAAFDGRDEDQYGRKLRVLVRGGRSLGDQLVSEGLARTWTGRREPWC